MTSKLTILTNDELTETLRLATSGYPLSASTEANLRHAFAELQERRKADSEPVAWTDEEELRDVNVAGIGYLFGIDREANKFADPRRQIMLYRHAQPAPEKYNIGDTTMRHIFTPTGMTNVSNMQAVFDRVEAVLVGMEQPAPVVQLVPEEPPEHLLPKGNSRDATYRRGAAIQAWKQCRAAMLQAGNSPVIPDGSASMLRRWLVFGRGMQNAGSQLPHNLIAETEEMLAAADCSIPMISDRWVPVSERMPEDEQEVLTRNRMGHCFVSFFDQHSGLFFDRLNAPAACCIEHMLVTHWMPLPAAPQEVK